MKKKQKRNDGKWMATIFGKEDAERLSIIYDEKIKEIKNKQSNLKFSYQTKQKLKYYVYLLTTKINNNETIFYVGKGKGDRVFEHFKQANKIDTNTLDNISPSVKLKTIKENECKAYIAAAELTEKESFQIESVLISVLYKFQNAQLTNLVHGQHEFQITNVHNIEINYAKPISLEDVSKKHNINILALKSTQEAYDSTVNKDFRGVLEGMWRVDSKRLKNTDYVIGIIESKIYAVYKLNKESITKISNIDQKQLDKWNKEHIAMGRPVRYSKELDDADISKLQQKTIFKLSPIALPETQKIKPKKNMTKQDKEFGKQLLNRTINDKKTKGRNSLCYFGKNNN